MHVQKEQSAKRGVLAEVTERASRPLRFSSPASAIFFFRSPKGSLRLQTVNQADSSFFGGGFGFLSGRFVLGDGAAEGFFEEDAECGDVPGGLHALVHVPRADPDDVLAVVFLTLEAGVFALDVIQQSGCVRHESLSRICNQITKFFGIAFLDELQRSLFIEVVFRKR